MAVDFRANAIQPYSNFINENWRNGIILNQGDATYNNTLRCKVVGPNNEDWTWKIPNGYRFMYRAKGYTTDADADKKVEWALVFYLYSKASYSILRNRLCVQPYLNVYGDSSSKYYRLEPASRNVYVQDAPVQSKGSGASGSIYGNDQIVEMYESSGQTVGGYCQITCCGTIPYSEVSSTKCINIEYSRISAGMVQDTITFSAWYKKNYGSNLSYNGNTYNTLYHTDNTTYSGSCNLLAKTLTVPSVVSYHQANVVASTDNDCFAIWDGQQQWGKGSSTLSLVTTTSSSIKARANYWVDSNRHSVCNLFYKESTIPVQFLPQNVDIKSNVDQDGGIDVLIKKHTPEGDKGYFDKITFTDGTTDYVLTGYYYNQDYDIYIERGNNGKLIIDGTQTDLGGNSEFTLTIYCDCSIKSGHGTSYTLDFSTGLSLSGVTLDYPICPDGTSHILYDPIAHTADFCFSLVTTTAIPSGYKTEVFINGNPNPYSYEFSTNKIKVKNVDIWDSFDGEIYFDFSLKDPSEESIGSAEVTATIVQDAVFDVGVGDQVHSEDLSRLIPLSAYSVGNCSRISSSASSSYDTLMGLSSDKEIISSGVFNTMVSELSKVYLEIVDSQLEYEVSSGVEEPPIKRVDIDGFLTNPIEGNTLMMYEQNDIQQVDANAYELVDQGAEGHTLVINDFKKDLIIADTVQFSESGRYEMIVLNNYQKAILYIIENIYL